MAVTAFLGVSPLPVPEVLRSTALPAATVVRVADLAAAGIRAHPVRQAQTVIQGLLGLRAQGQLRGVPAAPEILEQQVQQVLLVTQGLLALRVLVQLRAAQVVLHLPLGPAKQVRQGTLEPLAHLATLVHREMQATPARQATRPRLAC